MRTRLVAGMVGISGALAVAAAETPPAPAPDLPEGLYAEFTTPHGPFVVELHADRAPLTVGSFVGLAEGQLAARPDGAPFYTGLVWYRVVPGFVIQSGDPTHPGGGIQDRPPRTAEDEAAGHPYAFPDEFAPGLRHDAPGVLSMANGGPDTNSSEFFLTLAPTPRLNYLHSVFGRTVRGVEVLAEIEPGEAFAIRIHRIGAAARAFAAGPAALAARRAAARSFSGPTEPGPAAAFADPDRLLPQDVPRARNFNFKLANFERFTGRKVRARVLREFRPAHAGQTPGAWHAGLAAELGVKDDGVLASYFADRAAWELWVGEAQLPLVLGRAVTPETRPTHAELARWREGFLAEARARGAAAAAEQAAAGRPVSDAQRLKLEVDEVLDALIALLEPRP